jgi:hypothetical protein
MVTAALIWVSGRDKFGHLFEDLVESPAPPIIELVKVLGKKPVVLSLFGGIPMP